MLLIFYVHQTNKKNQQQKFALFCYSYLYEFRYAVEKVHLKIDSIGKKQKGTNVDNYYLFKQYKKLTISEKKILLQYKINSPVLTCTLSTTSHDYNFLPSYSTTEFIKFSGEKSNYSGEMVIFKIASFSQQKKRLQLFFFHFIFRPLCEKNHSF